MKWDLSHVILSAAKNLSLAVLTKLLPQILSAAKNDTVVSVFQSMGREQGWEMEIDAL